MKLIVGLGNPGLEHQKNRHNVGFLALSTISSQHAINLRLQKSFNSRLGKWLETPNLLVLPQTFMNNSGAAIAKLIKNYQLSPSDVLVIYDESDLAFGVVRTRRGGTSAGHNGIKSVIKSIGDDFYRLRIGINNNDKLKIGTEKFVLKDFNKQERLELAKIWDYVHQVIEEFIKTGELKEHTEVIISR